MENVMQAMTIEQELVMEGTVKFSQRILYEIYGDHWGEFAPCCHGFKSIWESQ